LTPQGKRGRLRKKESKDTLIKDKNYNSTFSV